jgi:hypothetical protein
MLYTPKTLLAVALTLPVLLSAAASGRLAAVARAESRWRVE